MTWEKQSTIQKIRNYLWSSTSPNHKSKQKASMFWLTNIIITASHLLDAYTGQALDTSIKNKDNPTGMVNAIRL
jgi:hypothetical protein